MGIHEGVTGSDAALGAASGLAIIAGELMETIRAAQVALEDCVDGQGGRAALTRAADLLHAASGALRMTETYGAGLLIDEMELCCKFVMNLRDDKGREDGLEALTRAMVQLPVYIERLLGGGRDIALVILPMLNDLRAARREPLLSEGTLLLLNLSPSRSKDRRGQREGTGEDPVVVSQRLRPKFQLALLGWIKGGENQRHLETLSKVAASLEHSATRDDMYQLWMVVGGVLESLQNGGLETSVALKRLLGQADRQIKYVIDEGLLAYETHPVDDLLNNLLYYVARSSKAGERISRIRAAFNLEELMPGDEQVEHAREALSAPSAKLMETVGSAIREDLGRVKDVLDIFVRTGMNKSSELVPQVELLKKISDTLGVLGLGELRGDIDGEIRRLKGIVEQGGIANEGVIMDIASTLLRVEDRLEHQLMRLTQVTEPETAAEQVADEDGEDFQKVTASVMRECIINLARIKETISQSVGANTASAGLDSVPSLVGGIKAGLLMLDKRRAMEVVDRVGSLVNAMLSAGGTSSLAQKETDRLADAIVSIEYYMETVKAGRSEPWYMLDNAEACLQVLGDVEERLKRVEYTVPEVATRETGFAPTATQPVDQFGLKTVPHVATGMVADMRPQATQVIPPPVVSRQAEHMDPELLELFIEEAKEEIASIKRRLPKWMSEPDDLETLISVRRSFHTLKGSGRMVGAERIAEYCWAVENLLNRLINRTLQCTPPMVDFIATAAAAVPELVEQLEVGTEPRADIGLLIARASAFAEGDPNAAVLQSQRPAGELPEEEEPALEMDPVLYDIFSKETAGHLKVITDYLAACEGHTPPFDVTDKLYRACHTLHGSANMANVERGVAVAAALNRFVRHVYDHRVGFGKSGLDALRAGERAIHAIVRDINNPKRERADYRALINHLGNLTEAVEAKAVAAEAVEAEQAVAPPPQAAASGPTAQPRPPKEPAPVVEIVAEEPGYDAEIAAIFTEESAELLEAADQALVEWTRERATQAMEELKRHLHTLKGGARMAGISAMGDLSHEIETLLISVNDGRVRSTPAVDELMQRSIDELHHMRDLVIAGKPVRAVPELEQRIQQANAGYEVEEHIELGVASADGLLEEAPSTEFTQEPDESVSMVIVDPSPAGDLEDLGSEYATQVPSGHEVAPTPEPEPEFRPEPAPPVETVPPPEPAPPPEFMPSPEFMAPEVPPPVTEAPSEAQPRATRDEPAAEDAPAELRPVRSIEQRQEFARVDADLLEDLLNAAGEISIYHSRLNQQVNSFDFHVAELESTIARLREQLRKLEIETEAQIMHGHQDTLVASRDFDPLELDRYSDIQQLSRALAESANDLGSLKDLLKSVTNESEGLLVQQARVTAELQDGLMRTRMIPFERYVPRLTRLVRQVAQEAGKRAELAVEGASGELDRQVLEKMMPPFEHMLRNAVVHGIEAPYERQAAGKPAVGRITIRLHREGAEMVIDIADDGSGLDVGAIRRKAYENELLQPGSKATDEEIMQFILAPGFSTASTVTQTAGRGVGMDVVANEVKKLGGSLRISSVTGQGTNFTVRLPFTLAITQALIVRTGAEVYALPLPTVEGVARVPRAELESLLSHTEPSFQYGEQTYKFRHLGMYLGGQAAKLPEDDTSVPVILVQAGEFSAALLVDELLASREIVVKALGPQLASIRGISGATILGDGSIVLILDVNALVRTGAPVVEMRKVAPAPTDNRPLALVVDDSITVRRVTERFLSRNGMRVETAKDGLDAIGVMQEHKPDVILLDIEMPNMDGYEFASHVRNDPQVADVPIIMITSRVGDKHRARAIELGVNDYLGKPYQDAQLLEAIRRQLEERGIELH
jgi:chemosensory pili system protein ChpA (sensor histidine kinase/response regulator)